MNVPNLISSEMRFPSETSKKKKRYVTFGCPRCSTVEEKVYIKSQFVPLCSHCAKGGYTTEDFIKKGKQHFGNFYDYSKTTYINKRSNVTIICPVHGEFTQRAQEHLNGAGCRKCADKVRSELYTLDSSVWLERLKNYPHIKLLSKPTHYHDEMIFECEYHGQFKTQLGQIGQSKFLCNKCADFKHTKQTIRKYLINNKAVLYYCYLPLLNKYKLGVSTNVNQRYRSFRTKVEPILEIEGDYQQLVDIEHKLHTDLEHLRYKGTKLIESGSTELYNEDILNYIRALQG